jgi:hypothetical protein
MGLYMSRVGEHEKGRKVVRNQATASTGAQ